MTNSPTLLTEFKDKVACLTLNQPEKLNALSPEMLLRIPAFLQEAVDAGARAILIAGAGRAFCSGAQLGASGSDTKRDLGAVVDIYYNPMARMLSDLPIPVVSAINGLAAGAGASLALGADIIVAARSSHLLLAFSNIGLVPDAGATWLVAKAAGRVKALEMALLGERMSAEDALAAGLVTRVVEDAALMETAWDIARTLAAKPTMALGMIRKQIRLALDSSFAEALAVERAHQQQAGDSEDFAEGVSAFKDKRTPLFQGR